MIVSNCCHNSATVVAHYLESEFRHNSAVLGDHKAQTPYKAIKGKSFERNQLKYTFC